MLTIAIVLLLRPVFSANTQAIILFSSSFVRANTVSDLWGLVSYLFFDPTSYDEKSLKKISKDGLEKITSEIISQCKNRESASGFVENLKSWGEEIGIGAGQIMMTTRVILTGSLTGVGVQEIVSFIGLESVSRRAEKFGDGI